jgi:hypothetical protein
MMQFFNNFALLFETRRILSIRLFKAVACCVCPKPLPSQFLDRHLLMRCAPASDGWLQAATTYQFEMISPRVNLPN